MSGIIDCILFNGEIDLLLFRLHELQDITTHHVIVECAWSFTKRWLGLTLPQHLERLQPFLSKIHYLPILTYPHTLPDDNWKRERYVRNYASKYLKDNFSAADVVIVADLDEVPRPIALAEYLHKHKGPQPPTALEMDFYYYNFQWQKTSKWPKAYLVSIAQLPDDLDATRLAPKTLLIPNAGWHMSYFLTVEQIQAKLQNFAHSEYSGPQYTNSASVSQAIKQGTDLFHRGYSERLVPRAVSALLPEYLDQLPVEYRPVS
jgi:beta-1,4-mannosyl-glycoprotein beta-1,4-N-acetylglucosaminyltransferase